MQFSVNRAWGFHGHSTPDQGCPSGSYEEAVVERFGAWLGKPEKIRRLPAVIKKNFDEAADLHVLNCSSDGGCVAADPWPRRGHQDHDAKANAAQVVLVTKTLVSRDQDFVAIEHRNCQQITIFQLVPSFLKDRVDFMLSERPAERGRRALVEQDLHAEAWSSRLAAANSSTASTCSRVTPGNHSTN